MSKRVRMYSTNWCAACRNAKQFLSRHDVPIDEVDIDGNDAAARLVIEWSGGRRVIPTFHIEEEGKAPVILHNPPITVLAQQLGLTS
jgi:glutaredoxin